VETTPTLGPVVLLRVLGALALVTLARAARGVPRSMGARRARLRPAATTSPHAVDGRFRNREPGVVIRPGSGPALARAALTRGRSGRPGRAVPLATDAPPHGRAGPLAVTWFGHSTLLLEIDGHRVLADPVWSERVSPSRLVGPRRLHPVPVALEALPAPDAVIISHDHYDHLDLDAVQRLVDHCAAPFVVPLGVGGHLRRWGVPEERIIERDWDDSVRIGDLTLVCTEARHFSGRGLTRNTTQWSSWAVIGPRHRAFFGGDTGFTSAFARIGAQLGPFDLAALPIGAYSAQWPDIHMTPEQAARAHQDLRGDRLIPVHWATFDLGFHRWAEPVERLRAATRDPDIPLILPRPGERIDLRTVHDQQDWWSPSV
jgi:L-ascorbate metabolism protein UlaG (beta-lactamase superfamily)